MYAKIFGALLVVGLVSAGLGYATFAFFSDTETASANVFTAGDLDLHLDGQESITGKFVATNFAPGDTLADNITLTNVGSIFTGDAEGHVVDLDFTFDVSTVDDTGGHAGDADDGGISAIALETFIQVTLMEYDGADLLSGVVDSNGNSRIDLADLEAHGTFADLADPGAAGKDLEMRVLFVTEGGNDLKRDETTFVITFFLAQAGETDL